MNFMLLNIILFFLMGYMLIKFYLSFKEKKFFINENLSINKVVMMISGISFCGWITSLFGFSLEHQSPELVLIFLPAQIIAKIFQPLFGELANSLATSLLVIVGFWILNYRISRR